MAILKPWYLQWVFDGECANTAQVVEIFPTKEIHDISHLIKINLTKELRNVPEDRITIWHVCIQDDGGDDSDLPIVLDSISHKRKLKSKPTISTVFPNGVPVNTIHLIVQPLATTFEIFGLVGQYNHHAMFDWSTIVETATLADLRKRLYRSYPELACDDQYIEIGVPIRGDFDEKSEPIHDDESLRSILRVGKVKFEPYMDISIRTPSKNFSSRTYKDVCDLYGLFDTFSDIRSIPFPPRPNSRVPVTEVDWFIDDIRSWVAYNSPWPDDSFVMATSRLIDQFLNQPRRISYPNLCLRRQGYISGRKWYGPIHHVIHSSSLQNPCILGGITVVNWRGDFEQGIIQNVAQLESAVLGRDFDKDGIIQDNTQLQLALAQKKGLDMHDVERHRMGRTYGIVTDAETWAFLECTLNEDYKISFRMSRLKEKVDYRGTWEADALSVCEQMVWLFLRIRDEIPVSERRTIEELPLLGKPSQ